MQIHVPKVWRCQHPIQLPLSVHSAKCKGTYCGCPLLLDYVEINFGLQLMISLTFISTMLSSVGNPRGGMVPLVAEIC